ncbi:MAG: D-lactate dehydrogenase [Elusimicrobia bacterium]|nr:D-lactate dehydrogenase [Elusimicrobiota bacterium]
MITVSVYDTKPYDRDALIEASKGQGIEWRFVDFRLSAETALSSEGSSAVCVFVNDQVDRPCLEALKRLGVRLVVLRCTGYNNVDLKAAAEMGIAVTRAASYSPYAVAEHAVALLLTLNRKVHRSYNRVREQNFSLHGLVGFDLHGKTAGLIGTGRIGRVMGEILRGFGMTVLAYDPFPTNDWAKRFGVQYVEPKTLASRSDVVSLHIPLTPETHHIIRRETLALMKPGALLINVSRGKLIDTKDLIEALKSGQLGGVGLDVYEEEEGIFFEDLSGRVLQDDELARLLTFPNVVVTAHQAFLTQDALSDIARITVKNLLALSSGSSYVEGTTLDSSVPGPAISKVI